MNRLQVVQLASICAKESYATREVPRTQLKAPTALFTNSCDSGGPRGLGSELRDDSVGTRPESVVNRRGRFERRSWVLMKDWE